MSIPMIKMLRVGAYVMKQHLRGRKRYPLVLMLEPLFRCNLACPGCGKIDYPDKILNQRLTPQECFDAAEECGAPVISIPGGEPLLHKEIGEIVNGLIERKKFIHLCTNALLLEKKMDLFKPSPYLAFSVHLDGLEDAHDKAVNQPGTFVRAVKAIRKAREKGFDVTINCTLFNDAKPDEVSEFLDYVHDELGVSGVTISPGYAYERAPDQQHFLNRQQTKTLFRDVFRIGKQKKRKWSFTQSSLFLDFLAGNQTYNCTPWGMPTRNVFGWQRPCYLLNEGYTSSYKELMEETKWDDYGTGNYAKCADCMVHCGYEATAVADSVRNPLKTIMNALRGPKLDGPMAPELDMSQQRPAEDVHDQQIQKGLELIEKQKTGEQAA